MHIVNVIFLRSNRLAELNIQTVLNLTPSPAPDAVNFCGLSDALAASCEDDEGQEYLERVVERLREEKDKVCLIEASDTRLSGLVCMAHFVRNLDRTVAETLALLDEKKLGFEPDQDTLRRLRRLRGEGDDVTREPEMEERRKMSHFRWVVLAVLGAVVAAVVAYVTKKRLRDSYYAENH